MSVLTTQEIHDRCLITTQAVVHRFGWHTVTVTMLSDDEKRWLANGVDNSALNWSWAMDRYSGNAEDGILDISLKVVDHENPNSLHAVILCKYDERREQFSICMLENFIRDEDTLLSGNVLIIALIYSTTFCAIMDLEEIYIQDPTREARPRYLSYGFAQVWCDHNKMSAEVTNVLQCIQQKVDDIDFRD